MEDKQLLNKITQYSKEDMKFILEHTKELSYLNLDWDLIKKIKETNGGDHPLKKRTLRPEVDLLRVIRDPNNFHFTCKHILNKDILPYQNLILRELWHRPFPMLIGSRGAAKTFCLALYCTLRGLINQGCSIIITGAAFRQAKVVFEYIERIWESAPILRDLCSNNTRKQGAHRDSDRWWFAIGESTISALPIGDGSKIRGYRANYLISDEWAAQNPQIYEEVIAGFAFVASNPIDKVKEEASIQTLKDFGLWTPQNEIDLNANYKGNQSILAGTAYYSWNHFYSYYRRYKAIVESMGDPDKLEAIFQGPPPEGFNWKDYSVMRVPLELIPKGLMDKKQITRSKATTHSTVYMMEFGACESPDTLIVTDKGVKKIVDIDIGDMVLTHKGRFRPVTKKLFRKYDNKIVDFKTYGYNQNQLVTPNHPFYINNKEGEWMPLGELEDKVYLSNLKKVSNKGYIDARDYTQKFVQVDDYIYPKSSQNKTKLSNEDILDIKASSLKPISLAEKYGLPVKKIYAIKYSKVRKPKNSVKYKIPLDYNFGLVVGYYAAEGSCSRGSVGFALDGHVDESLEFFVNQLSEAIYNVFGFHPKKYAKKTNTVDVSINSRIIRDLLKSICPGVAGTKYILPEILYSNEEFMKGVITGYWNGDGHKSDERNGINANSTSINLATQIRTAISYFNIATSFNKRDGGVSTINGKEYNCSDYYVLSMDGDNSRKFKNIFYDIDYTVNQSNKSYILNNEGCSEFKFISKELVDYNDFVYNLEVEEDNSYSLINATVHNCFATDSDGFFKRSLIESCVTKEPIYKEGGAVQFKATVNGNPSARYVYGIDPASESDKFSIVILELCGDHSRIVYCWTTDKEDHREKKKTGAVRENDFYSYVNRKVRTLMKIFPCQHIAMDSQGGGISVMEAFRNTSNLEGNELPLLMITPSHVLSDKKERDSDNENGLHIVELVNFAKYDWTSAANHNMKMDFEQKNLLFPYFDPMQITIAETLDNQAGRTNDTLEDCILEIEELKDELATIVLTPTPTGKEHFDTPETKVSGSKKGRMRKDRYSALLMANAAARALNSFVEKPIYVSTGGFAGQVEKPKSTRLYNGPAWFTNKMGGSYGNSVVR